MKEIAATKEQYSLPEDVKKKLESIEGALALAEECSIAARRHTDSLQNVYQRKEIAARSMANHLSYLKRVQSAAEAIERDRKLAADNTKSCHDELLVAIETRDFSEKNLGSTSQKLSEVQEVVSKKVAKQKELVDSARLAFSAAMSGEDAKAQRRAAEELSQSEEALRMLEKSDPDWLRLQALRNRLNSEKVNCEEASRSVTQALNRFNNAVFQESVVLLDEACDKMARSYIEMYAAQRACINPKINNYHGHITFSAGSGERITTALSPVKAEPMIIESRHLIGLSESALRPDLSVFEKS